MRCLETRTGKTECVKEKWNHTELNTTLLDACMVGDVARVKFILSDGQADINSVGKDNMTPVMYAANEGHGKVFELLVKEGANLSLINDRDRNILHLACIGGSVEIVKYVFSQNIVGINRRDEDGRTPAMTAAFHKRKDVFDLLVEEEADLLLESEFGETILHVACEGGNVQIVKYLVKHDIVDIDSRDYNNWTPVMRAASGGHKDVFDVLVEAGAYLSQVNNEKETILHLACAGGSIEIIKYLMKYGIVDIDSRDINGWTPVMHAVRNEHSDVFDVLVEAGADLSQVSNDKETILHLACRGENVEIFKYLMKYGIVDIDSRDKDGWTPVMHAVSDGHKDMVNVLVQKGADLSQVSDDKQTILHMACGRGNTDIIKYLLKNAILDIDRRDINGWTPLMQAANAGNIAVFDALVEAGADLSQVNNNKETILHMASGVGNVDIIKYLLKHDIVEINSQDWNGLTPVMRAAKDGHKDVFDVLVEAGADLSRVSEGKGTTLHVACVGGNVGIINYLLKHDIVDIDSRGEDGLTPVMQAAIEGCKDVFDLLVKWDADLSLLDDDNDNILHLACNGDVEIVKYLLTLNMFDINCRDVDDCTPAMIAARLGHEAIFFLLVENEADLTIMNDIGDNILNMACKGENVHIVKYVSTRHIVEGPYREDDPC